MIPFKTAMAKTFATLLTLCMVGIVFPCYVSGYFGNTRARVQLDHSIDLPRSTSEIQCAGPISTTQIWDGGAESAFKISRADLPGVLAQFHGYKTSPSDSAGGLNIKWNLSPAWTQGAPAAVYAGTSAQGNQTVMEVWPIDSASVGIRINTVWN